VTKNLYIRNLGNYGKMKVDGAYFEGGDGAFTFAQPLVMTGDSMAATTSGSCGSSKLDAYNVSSCVAYDPNASPGQYNHIRVQVTYKPLTGGTPKGNLVIWHNSKVVANPLVIPVVGVAAGDVVAGEVSATYSATVPAITDFGLFGKSGGTKDLSFYIRNPGPTGALYGEEATLDGEYFTLLYPGYKTGDSNGNAACGSALSTDKHYVSACLADTYDASNALFRHLKYTVRCSLPSSAPAGTYTATLRVKTQGKEHFIPLSCSKS
jgi:hypothetical protein